jgi:lysophospholipase L1-like esterase
MGKFESYTAITNIQNDDLLLVDDLHDTTMSASGTTKRMTVQQLTQYGVTGTTQYPDQLPAYEAGLTGTTGITALLAAVANQNAEHVDIPIIGDSITEGEGATLLTNRWISQANQTFSLGNPSGAAFGTGKLGGLGFIPFQTTGETTYTWPITLTSGSVGDILDLGPVRQSTGFTTTTAVWSFTAPANTTSVRICYYDGSTPGGFTYQVNSGSIITVNNTGVDLDKFTTTITMAGSDVLKISATGSGNCFITGIIHYNGDENSGVTFHGCGRFGWCAGTESNGWSKPETYSLNWAQAFVNAFPNTKAIGIMLGINDADASDGNRTATQYASDLQGLITLIRGADGINNATMPIILIQEYNPNITVADAGGWAAYSAATRSVAATNQYVYVIDLNYRMPSIASFWQSGELYSDNYHPSNTGHGLIGAIVAAGIRVA